MHCSSNLCTVTYLYIYCLFLGNWLNKSLSGVRWGSTISLFFILFTGVRHGGILSPTLFAIYINNLIVNVTSYDACGKLVYICISIFLYADDNILISSSVDNLQLLLTYCKQELAYLDMSINTHKNHVA